MTLTPVAQDYLKAVWSLQEWSDAPVTTSAIAARVGVGLPAVSEAVRRLVGQGWLEHEPYGAVRLTASGRDAAVAVVRRHRVLETWLVAELGYRWDEVHDEAEVLEHAVSDRLVAALAARLGEPVRDPHGDPVPAGDGSVVRPPAVRLTTLPPGTRAVVARVDDRDPGVLRACAALGLVPDAPVVAGPPLADDVAAALWVVVSGAASRRSSG